LFTVKDSSARLADCIDPRHNAAQSVVLRYRNGFRFGDTDADDTAFKELLAETSIREGARIMPFLTYRGVHIHLLDETSLMHTNSLKGIDGCYSMAKCRSLGYTRVVFESGGNTGTALTGYGSHAGIETFCFVPRENLSLLDSGTFRHPLSHLIAVDKPGQVKRAAHLFARLNGIKRIPETAWRYQASQFRGFFILEHIVKVQRFDWLVQTISAAFGPIGIYRVLDRFKDEAGALPRLLGIQQEANCPMYRAWKSGSGYVVPKTVDSTQKLLSRVMYDSAPHTYGTFEDLRKVLVKSRGDLITINHGEFAELLQADLGGKTALQQVQNLDIDLTEQSVEKTGLIALSGTLKEIRAGTIVAGSHVLCCITSGARHSDGVPIPYATIPRVRTNRGEAGAA
jgi:hypothetical protein